MIYVFAKDINSFKKEMSFPYKNAKFIKNIHSIKGITITDVDILYFIDDYKENPNYTIEIIKGMVPTIPSDDLKIFFINKFAYLIKDAFK